MKGLCTACLYWNRESPKARNTNDEPVMADCRRYPPIKTTELPPLTGDKSNFKQIDWGVWAVTRDVQWCGEWQSLPEPS